MWETNIAINICTFKREPFVIRNIDILHSSIIDHPDNPLYGHLQIYISDNGKSLPKQRLNNETVHIVENKNVGGAGGFARGLIEIMHNSEKFAATHALMMDDDVIIEPEALFRTYSLLRCRKQEYADLFVGGAMLRLDNQAIQVESGASWNAGKLVSNKSAWDLRKLDLCLLNEHEEYVEYNAWWYCCTPMQVVTSDNLPLPIFIRGDDLEYGLRNMKHLALMNGICVWHEAFENKYSSFLQYYILRNLLYDNSLHFENYKLGEFLVRLYKNVIREIVYYRYKNVALIFRGVKDFLKGVEFLKTTDGEVLHQQIMEKGYKAMPVDQLEGVAFRIDDYENSMEESENKVQKLWRFITLNGYLLPTKKLSENHMKVVSMAQCRPINFYRAKQVLNYDPASKKGFVTKRSWRQTIGIGFELIGMTVEIMMHFTKAKREFKKDVVQITNESFWEKYLSM